MHVEPFFHATTGTFSYVVSDPRSRQCGIIDPVLDFDPASGKLSSQAADGILDYLTANHLQVDRILETHCHADHLTAATYLQAKAGGRIGIGEGIRTILAHWEPILQLPGDRTMSASQFDDLFTDDDVFQIGNLSWRVLATPGHTPGCVTYLVEDAAFVGDVLLLPDIGTARTDFPGGDAGILFDSIQKILSLPTDTRLFTCHDYPPHSRAPRSFASVAQHQMHNILVAKGTAKADFVEKRRYKDKSKSAPRLLLPALQVNLRAGHIGPETKNGRRYFHIPLSFHPASLVDELDPSATASL